MEAAASPLPRLETTPPVTKMNLVMMDSPQSTFLLVRSPARCQRLSTGVRLAQREYRIRFPVREAARVLRLAQAVRASFEQTAEGIPRDRRTVLNAYDS